MSLYLIKYNRYKVFILYDLHEIIKVFLMAYSADLLDSPQFLESAKHQPSSQRREYARRHTMWDVMPYFSAPTFNVI